MGNRDTIKCIESGCKNRFPRRKGSGEQRSRCEKHRDPAYQYRMRYGTDPKFREKVQKRNQIRRADPILREKERKKDRERKRLARSNPKTAEKFNKVVRDLRCTPEGRAYLNGWRHANPDKVQASRHRRRNSKAVGKGFTRVQWVALKELYGSRCLGCGKTEKQLERIKRHLVPDHVVPIAHPSRRLWGRRGEISNIQPLCHCRTLGSNGGCNNKKGMKIVDYRPNLKE